MRTLLQSNLAQPTRSLRRRLSPGTPPRQQRHGDILRSREFRQQIVKLPDKTGLAIAKFRRFIR
jgi:hypothetical protein